MTQFAYLILFLYIASIVMADTSNSTEEVQMWPGSQPRSPKSWEDEYQFLKLLLKKAIEAITTRAEWECFYKMELWRFDNELSNQLMAQYWYLLPKPKKELVKRALDRMDGMSLS